ncbi:hypothetical protein DL93DRAFT_1835567 [Clavulina sp. PMI_390]|nr:hypothetical protein DL93DRAFT_1835567 [Clavulina sp. PMI_390]
MPDAGAVDSDEPANPPPIPPPRLNPHPVPQLDHSSPIAAESYHHHRPQHHPNSPPSSHLNAPSYHTESDIGPSPSYRRHVRPDEEIIAQGRSHYRPPGRFNRSSKLMAVSLGGQEPDATIPTFGRAAVIDGAIVLAADALDSVLQLEVKIEGEMKLVIAEGGSSVTPLLSHTIPLFFSASPTTCPATHTFSYRLPPRFEDGDTRRALPPTYEVNFSGVPGVRAEVRYFITIKLVRQKLWKRKESLVIPFVYFPRARPPQPILGMSFLSSLKSNPEEWSLFSSAVSPRFPTVDSVITSSFVLPSTNIFPMSHKIPFHLQLSLSPVKPPVAPASSPASALSPNTSSVPQNSTNSPQTPLASQSYAPPRSDPHSSLHPSSFARIPPPTTPTKPVSRPPQSLPGPSRPTPTASSSPTAGSPSTESPAPSRARLGIRSLSFLSSRRSTSRGRGKSIGDDGVNQPSSIGEGSKASPSRSSSRPPASSQSSPRIPPSRSSPSASPPATASASSTPSKPSPIPKLTSPFRHSGRKPQPSDYSQHSLLTPLLTKDATIRVTLQRQISVDVRNQKVLKTIVCGEGFIRRVDLKGGDGDAAGSTHSNSTVGGGEEQGDNEAGGFGVIREEEEENESDSEHGGGGSHRDASPSSSSMPASSSRARSASSRGPAATAARLVHNDANGAVPRSRSTSRAKPEAVAELDDWAGWEGEVIPSLKQISVGGFRAAGLSVRDFIILTLIPPDPETSPLRAHQHAVPVRIVTDAWDEGE